MQIGSLGINILGGGRRVIDETAPTISALSAGTQDAEGDVPVTLSVDEGGTFFWALVTAGATAPSAAEIEAGQASGGGSPADSGSLTVSANGGPYDIALAGGLDGSYDLYAVVRDISGNVSGVASDTGVAINTTASIELLYVSSGKYPASGTASGSSIDDRTISGLSLGDANANRRIIVALNALSSPAGSGVSGVTVAGVAATLVAEAVQSDGSTNAISQIWRADVPTDTTGDVVVSWENEGFDVQVDLYRLIHADGVPLDTATDTKVIASSLVLDVNTAAGGFVVATASNLNGNAVSITGATSDNSGDYRSNEHFNAASAETVTSETPRAITVTQSSAAAFAGVAASWAP